MIMVALRQTHTYARLELSQAAYDEIKAKLVTAGYEHAFIESSDGKIDIDMHGIGIASSDEGEAKPLLAVPDWFLGMRIQQQTVMMLASRGPDGIAKNHPAKNVVRAYRATVFRAAKYGRFLEYGEQADSFMCLQRFGSDLAWNNDLDAYFAYVDSLPHHYHMHLMHAAQIIGHHHPDVRFRNRWCNFYWSCCEDMHVPPEPHMQMEFRLNDWDREHWEKA